MRYRKKPVIVDAIQFIEKDFTNRHSKYVSFPIVDMANMSELWAGKNARDGRYYIQTLEGSMTVSEGDYIIKGVQGEFYPCKPDIFEMTYEKVGD